LPPIDSKLPAPDFNAIADNAAAAVSAAAVNAVAAIVVELVARVDNDVAINAKEATIGVVSASILLL
jgi:hypothetical protein